ncbi:hypothetical protein PV08_06578 [Exophiala spinifera]|uniref:Uncharacterized protein n=1 Tax=Exophiala spinifera TaxID=91928 RepID=A0A0D2BC44_9EURO|nr:uncharacterized protein PV08_06578 [Exophiala spinifera]KIW16523.1 hypothetical protein PV08_06578 [Exophiala spinifera]
MSESIKAAPDEKSISQGEALNEEQEEFNKIRDSLKINPIGVVCLGKDGVFRSLTADHDVIDAVALAPKHIKALLDRMPFSQEAADIWRGVDGTTVPREQWYNPNKDDLPPPLSEGEKEEATMLMEELKQNGVPSLRLELLRSNCGIGSQDHAAIGKSQAALPYSLPGSREILAQGSVILVSDSVLTIPKGF